MYTLLEGTVQYKLRILLLYYLKNNTFTLKELNNCIAKRDYGYSERIDQPEPLHESVFYGSECYKLKYNASETSVFLKALPFLIANYVETENSCYQFLVQIIQISHIIFPPVITCETKSGIETIN